MRELRESREAVKTRVAKSYSRPDTSVYVIKARCSDEIFDSNCVEMEAVKMDLQYGKF